MADVIYTSEMFPKMMESEYFCQFIEKRRLSSILHRHDFYEIILMLRGWTLQQVNETQLELKQGELVIFSPADQHCFLEQSEDCALLGLSILRSRFETVASAFGFEPGFGVRHLFSSGKFTGEQLFRLAGLPEKQKLLLNSLLCEIFLALSENVPEEEPWIPHFLQAGYARLAEPENIREGMSFLMRDTCYSRSQLYRLTVQYYRKTPSEMITGIRMNLAKEYLLNINDTLEVIAEKIGYHSVSQLHNAFRNYYKESPGAFRRRSRYHWL